MSFEEIKVGLIINITKQGFENTIIKSKVKKVFSDDKFLIETPIYEGAIVKLPVNSIYDFSFFTGEKVLKYRGKIIKNLTDGTKFYSFIEISKSENGFRRREYFRLDYELKINLDLLEEDEINLRPFQIDKDLVLSKGIINNISAGGSNFYSNEKFLVFDKIKCIIYIKDKRIPIFGEIIFSDNSDKKGYKYKYRCKFTKIEEKSAEEIAKFIFEEQRKKYKAKITVTEES